MADAQKRLTPTEALRAAYDQQVENLQRDKEKLTRELDQERADNTNLRTDKARLESEVQNLKNQAPARPSTPVQQKQGFGLGALLLVLLLGLVLGAGGLLGLQSVGIGNFFGDRIAVEETDSAPMVEKPAEETPTTSAPTDGTKAPVSTTGDEVGSDEDPTKIVLVNGDDSEAEAETLPVCEPAKETPPVCAVPEKDPCALPGLIKDLKGHFKFRDWDLSHVEDVEIAVSTWKHGDTEIDLKGYDFWGGRDAANLEAFVRDNRRGYADDAIVVDISETVRYTVFWCECGITAIYREVKKVVVYTPPKKPKKPGRPIGELPHMVCPKDNITCI